MSAENTVLNIKEIGRISSLPETTIFGAEIACPPFSGFVSLDLHTGNAAQWLKEHQLQPDQTELKLLGDAVRFKEVCGQINTPFDIKPGVRKATILLEKVARAVLESDPNKKLINFMHIANDLVDEKPWAKDPYYPKQALSDVAVGLGTQLIRSLNLLKGQEIPSGLDTLIYRGIALPLRLDFNRSYLELIAFSDNVDMGKVATVAGITS